MDEKNTNDVRMSELLSGILSDLESLVQKHFTLMRAELSREIVKLRTAAVSFSAGIFLLFAGVSFLLVMGVFLLSTYTTVPLWASFLIFGVLLVLAGGVAVYSARSTVEKVAMAPPETKKALEETARWAQDEASTMATKARQTAQSIADRTPPLH